MESDAAGVGVNQVERAQEHSVEIGVPTEFNPRTGAAIFRSRGHRKAYCEKVGLFDRDGGYGDPQKRDREAGEGGEY